MHLPYHQSQKNLQIYNIFRFCGPCTFSSTKKDEENIIRGNNQGQVSKINIEGVQ